MSFIDHYKVQITRCPDYLNVRNEIIQIVLFNSIDFSNANLPFSYMCNEVFQNILIQTDGAVDFNGTLCWIPIPNLK